MNQDVITEISYPMYKQHVLTAIKKKVVDQLKREKLTKTKLRWINPGKTQQYIEKCSLQEASEIIRLRLHMTKILANYGGGTCRKCLSHEETTEHVVQCATNGLEETDEEMLEQIWWFKKKF